MSNGKVVFITGSNSGFGRLTAETLARQGYSVYGSMRDTTGKNAALASEIADLAAKEHLDLNVVDLDVTDDASVERAIQHILATAGHIDVVVNNAGIFLQGPLEAYTLDQIHHQFDTNVYSVMRINRAVLPSMRARRSGLLIQVGSIVGRIALPGVGLYSASKFALEGLTEAYHHELAALGIDAVIVEPGTYPTGLGGKTIFARHIYIEKDDIWPGFQAKTDCFIRMGGRAGYFKVRNTIGQRQQTVDGFGFVVYNDSSQDGWFHFIKYAFKK